MTKKVRKAVFPVAGLGTRLLPATKAMPKEMLTLVDRPLIQHVVEEAKEAGIEHFIFVTSSGKTLLEDHFDRQHHLINTLDKRGKDELLQLAIDTEIPMGHMHITRQHTPLGLGHAIWCARELIGDEPFAVLLPDEMVLSRPGCLKQLMDVYDQKKGNILAMMQVPEHKVNKYGILDIGPINNRLAEIHSMIEKPEPAEAPSTYSITGRYILQPEIFDHLARHEKGAGGEIQLTDAMAQLLKDQPFHGCNFFGKRYDCGNKFGFIEANIAFALARDDMKDEIREMLDRFHSGSLPETS